MPVGGPFASRFVPEDLEALRAQELKAIGRVRVARDLTRPAAGLAGLLRREEDIRQKALTNRWSWRKPHFDTPLAQRQLRLLNALFQTLAKRQHEGEAWETDGELRVSCTIGNMHLRLEFALVGSHRTEMIGGYRRPARDLPASSPLRIALVPRSRSEMPLSWQDEAARKLETRIGTIAAELVVAGEAEFRRSLLEAAKEKDRQRQYQEEERLQRVAALEAKRVDDLRASGELLRRAEEIRSLVARVKAAIAVGGVSRFSGEQVQIWETWALSQADRLDPILSGQVLDHLIAPDLDRMNSGQFAVGQKQQFERMTSLTPFPRGRDRPTEPV